MIYYAIFKDDKIYSKRFSKSYTTRPMIYETKETANKAHGQMNNKDKFFVKEIFITVND